MPNEAKTQASTRLPGALRLRLDPEQGVGLEQSAGHPVATLGKHSLLLQGHLYRIGDLKVSHLPAERAAASLLLSFLDEGERVFPRTVGEFTVTVLSDGDALFYRHLTSPFQLYFDDKSVSDHLWSLAKALDSTALDEAYLLQFLLRRERLLHGSELTPLRGVRRLPAGHFLSWSRGKSPVLRTASYPAYPMRHFPRQKVEDVAPEIGRLMKEIIGDRLERFGNRPLVCQLSGGLDSSYLASLVGKMGGRAKAVMYSFPANPSHRFSETCARAVADEYGLELSILPPEVFFPFDWSGFHAYADEPSNFSWQGAVFGSRLVERVEDHAVIFCGSGSDQLFYRQPQILPWLLRRGKLPSFFRTLVDFSRVLQRSPVNLFHQTLLSLLPEAVYSPLLPYLDKLPFNPLTTEDINGEYHLLDELRWLEAGVGSTASLRRKVLSEERAEHRRLFPLDGELRASLAARAEPQMSFVPFLHPLHVDYQMPFSDQRLLDFVFKEVSWHLIYDWKAPYKHLLREAEKGVVPEITRTRPKNEFDFCGFRGKVLADNKAYLRTLLREEAGHWEFLDLSLLEQEFDKMLFGINSGSSRSLFCLLSYLVWWRDFRAAAGGATP